MYDIRAYGAMIEDTVRTDAYQDALRRVVRPGSVVLDIGTGTGILALLSARLGARRVYAVEPSDYLQTAREIARENGLEDRIVFLQEESTKVDLPERADVIVSDIRGLLPLFGQNVVTIVDARRRHLARGGLLVPARDRIYAAVVSARETYEALCRPWSARPYSLSMNSPLRLVLNRMHKVELEAGGLAVEPAVWAELDYAVVEDPGLAGDLRWTVEAPVEAHGLALWFDAVLAEGVGFSGAPGGPGLIYGHAFFPWPRPLQLASGTVVDVRLRADLVSDDYQWRWRTAVTSAAGEEGFDQSTFLGQPLSKGQLAKASTGHVPRLGSSGKLARAALELMDGENDLETVARRVAAKFPDRFEDWQSAFREVERLARSFAR